MKGAVNSLLIKSVGGSKFGGVAEPSAHREDVGITQGAVERWGKACRDEILPGKVQAAIWREISHGNVLCGVEVSGAVIDLEPELLSPVFCSW